MAFPAWARGNRTSLKVADSRGIFSTTRSRALRVFLINRFTSSSVDVGKVVKLEVLEEVRAGC